MGFDALTSSIAIIPSSKRRQVSTSSTSPRLRRLAMIGNFPPRRCGIATFTRDAFTSLRDLAPGASWRVVAVTDPEQSYAYAPDVTDVIDQEDVASYVRAADALNDAGVDVVFLQHEFGIFGGEAGAHLLLLMRRLRAPIIVTLHTVLERPNPAQKRVLDEILALSAGAIVMSERGADIIARVHNVGPSKVHVIPHGAPERPFSSTEPFKTAYGLSGRKVIMTFGLLSPNKGIETIIRALPEILLKQPDALYVVVGATHPHLLALEGETYRKSLIELAASLGVVDRLHFINRFVDDAELVDLLQAADIYVTPYLTEAQITSGTLSYAVALGKPVVSTPYWHAVDALAGGVGVICGFHDSAGFGREIENLLSNNLRRETMARRAWRAGEPSRWRKVARSVVELALACKATSQQHAAASLRALVRPSLAAIRRITDDCGVVQHATFRVADRRHGYCVDDTARALSLFARLSREGDQGDAVARQTYTCAAFLNHAWNPEQGRFRNFMGYDRRWLDEGGSDDCCARAFEALAQVAKHSSRADLRLWASSLASTVFPRTPEWSSIRARAHLIKAFIAAEGAGLSRELAAAAIETAASAMLRRLETSRIEGHPWFEASLSYDNARLPEALLLAGAHLGRPAWLEAGLETLTYIMQKQRSSQGWFSPVATSTFDADSADDPSFDQQPIEALATVDGCAAAWRATQDGAWIARAEAAFMWFAGHNDHGMSLATPEDGGCHDGLTAFGVNQNQGAESILSYHLAAATMRSLNIEVERSI